NNERRRTDPHVAVIARDDALFAEPRHLAVTLACGGCLEREELERHVCVALREEVTASHAERAGRVVEDGEAVHGAGNAEAYSRGGILIWGMTGGGSSAIWLRRRMR